MVTQRHESKCEQTSLQESPQSSRPAITAPSLTAKAWKFKLVHLASLFQRSPGALFAQGLPLSLLALPAVRSLRKRLTTSKTISFT